MVDGGFGRSAGLAQESGVKRGEALDRGPIEEVGAVFDKSADTVFQFFQHEAQIKAGGAAAKVEGLKPAILDRCRPCAASTFRK